MQALLHLLAEVDGDWRTFGRAYRDYETADAVGRAWVAKSPKTRFHHITLVR